MRCMNTLVMGSQTQILSSTFADKFFNNYFLNNLNMVDDNFFKGLEITQRAWYGTLRVMHKGKSTFRNVHINRRRHDTPTYGQWSRGT